MLPVSVVIIAKNECETIARTINMARLITNDIVIIDSGSTDHTEQITRQGGCRFVHADWLSYGANKNKGSIYARYNWILSLDADEVPDNNLITALYQNDYDRVNMVYDIRFKTYFGDKRVRFGAWGRDHHIRLFNKTLVKWDEQPVHETLVLPPNTIKKKLNGHIHHYSVKDDNECRQKSIHYATLGACKYFNYGKQRTFVKQYLSPAFGFIKGYVFLLGFLDGKAGWCVAVNSARHTWLKYQQLYQLQCDRQNKEVYADSKLVIGYQ
jgi:glycosyltransferase involved in cell wall biosynthesis